MTLVHPQRKTPHPTVGAASPPPPAGRRVRRVLTRRFIALAALIAVLGAVAPWPAAPPASAGDCVKQTLTGAADASVLKLTALDLRTLGGELPTVADVRLGRATSDVGTARRPVSHSTARHADAALTRLTAPAPPGALAEQAAPPQAPAADTAELAGGYAEGLYRARSGGASAAARWRPAYHCATSGTLTASEVRLAEAELAPGGERVPLWQQLAAKAGADVTSLLRVEHAGAASTSTALRRVAGRRGISVTAATSMSGFTLFPGTRHEITAKVLRAPRLTVTTAGTRSTTSVTYSAPLLELTLPNGSTRELYTAGNGFQTSVGLDATSPLTVRVHLAQARVETTAHGIVSEGGLARLQLLRRDATLADIAIGAVSASASVGTGAPAPEASASPGASGPPGESGGTATGRSGDESRRSGAGHGSASGGSRGLPVTGGHGVAAAGGGALLLALGAALVYLARRRRTRPDST